MSLKSTLLTTAFILSLATFQPALANDMHQDEPPQGGMEHGDHKGGMKEDMKEKWATMSKEEKLKFINEHHEAKKKKMEERWNSMSDDEKIAKFEKRMKKRGERAEGRKEKREERREERQEKREGGEGAEE